MNFEYMSVEQIYAIGSVINSQQLMGFLGVLGFVLIISVIFSSCGKLRKSKEYRQFKADMFVAAKIDKLAKKEGLCLAKENQKFLAWTKRDRNQMIDLDNAIEEDLKDKINKDFSAEELVK